MAIRTEAKLRVADRLIGQQLAGLQNAYAQTLAIVDDGTSQFVRPLNQRAGRPHSGKQVVSLRLDPDVIAKYRATGPGWQARINEILRDYAL